MPPKFKFADNAKVESLDSVHETFRPFYAKSEGEDGYVLREEFTQAASAIDGLNKALITSRSNEKKADLSPLSQYGDSVESIVEGVTGGFTERDTKISELESQLAKGAKINPDKMREEIAKSYIGDIEKLTTRNGGLKTQLYTMAVENVATAAIAAAKGMPELLMPFVKQQVKIEEREDKLFVYVIDGDGDLRHGVNGQPLTIGELVTEMKGTEKYGRLFESEAPRGGGAPPNAGSNGASALRPPGRELSSTEKISAGLDKNRTRYGIGT